MEQRLFRRRTCDVPVTLQVPGTASIHAVVRNLCRDGLLVQSAARRIPVNQTVRITLEDADTGHAFGAWATVVHTTDGCMGLHLERDDEDALRVFLASQLGECADAPDPYCVAI